MELPKGKNPVIARFKEGPAILEKALSGLPEKYLDKAPAKGGWTIRQIVHHLADGDDIWMMAVKQAIGNSGSEFSLDWYRACSQMDWAQRWAYSKRPLQPSLALLKANRDHIAQLLKYIPESWEKSVAFRNADGQTELVAVGAIIDMQAQHIVHHTNRVIELKKQF